MNAHNSFLFYNFAQLSVIKTPSTTTRLLRAGLNHLAERNNHGKRLLCAQDKAGSLLLTADRHGQTDHNTFTAYGHDEAERARTSVIGFNGEFHDTALEGYLLGNGHRLYCPGIMRFYSADALSPFNAGGLNAYAYCSGDPIGKIDPSGQAPFIFKPVTRFYSWLSKRLNARRPNVPSESPNVPSEALPPPSQKKLTGVYYQIKSTDERVLETISYHNNGITNIYAKPVTSAPRKLNPIQLERQQERADILMEREWARRSSVESGIFVDSDSTIDLHTKVVRDQLTQLQKVQRSALHELKSRHPLRASVNEASFMLVDARNESATVMQDFSDLLHRHARVRRQ